MPVEDVKHVTVVGAGLMGHGIGLEFALAGYAVVFHDLNEGALEAAMQRVETELHELTEWGLMEAGHIEPTLDRIQATTVLEEAGGEVLGRGAEQYFLP